MLYVEWDVKPYTLTSVTVHLLKIISSCQFTVDFSHMFTTFCIALYIICIRLLSFIGFGCRLWHNKLISNDCGRFKVAFVSFSSAGCSVAVSQQVPKVP